MKKSTIYLLCLLLNLFISVSYAQNTHTPTEADHEALRDLLSKSTQALNEQKFDELRPLLDDKLTVITLDNKKYNSLEEFKAYWDSMFKGDKPTLKSVTIKPVADEKTFFPAPNVGIVDGTAEETYHFTDGDVKTIQTRWSAVVHKDNNQWKIMNIHFSGSILDNPVLTALKSYLYKIAGGSALIGLILGFLLGKGMCRKKANA